MSKKDGQLTQLSLTPLILIMLVPLVVLARPSVAANTPGKLVQELAQAAHNGDIKGFLANMSADTQLAMAGAEATESKLLQAQRDFLATLDERFGKWLQGQQPIIADRKTTLSRFVNIELIGVEQKTSNEARLRLKTITKGSGGRIATQEDTFPAVEERGQWKLELTDLTRGLTQTAAQ